MSYTICILAYTKGAFYEAFEPERARALVRRIEFCDTPKLGNWLNIAENELSAMTLQCISGSNGFCGSM